MKMRKILLIQVLFGMIFIFFPRPVLATDILPGVDLWETPAGGGTYTNFLVPIPAGFFGPGSDPFEGQVALEGEPPGILGQTDMVTERLDTARFTQCGDMAIVPVEIVALSLVSIDPITVTYNGGLDPELWDAAVCLSSAGSQSSGTMSILKECESGGSFTIDMPIVPKWIFTRQLDGETIVMDWAETGWPALNFVVETGFWRYTDPGFSITTSSGGLTWNHDCEDSTSEVNIGASSNFFPGLMSFPCNCSDPDTLSLMRITNYIEDIFGFVSLAVLPPLPAGQPDSDGDEIHDIADNCISIVNPLQEDRDYDAVGDNCDNCPDHYNPDQADSNSNGYGDACEYLYYNTCCFPDGSCELMLSEDCELQGGVPDPELTECLGDNNENDIDDACEEPTGACCLPNGSCLEITYDECIVLEGEYFGNGWPCLGDSNSNSIDDRCEPPGACCYDEGFCEDGVTEYECSLMGGEFLGAETFCRGDNNENGTDDACETLTGACCLDDSTCATISADSCYILAGTYLGDYSFCEGDNNGNGIDDACEFPEGACCYNDGLCMVTNAFDCDYIGGVFLGPESICWGDNNGNGKDDLCDGLEPSIDQWKTVADDNSFVDFSVMNMPADFFGPGSDPFDGRVYLRGEPLDGLENTDTAIRRHNSYLPSQCGESISVPIEIVALSLINVDPIIVTYNGGLNPEEWDLKICLSSVADQDIGNLLLEQTCDEGGVFDIELYVIPKFIYTRRGDNEIRLLDLGDEVFPPLPLTNQSGFWLFDSHGYNIVLSSGEIAHNHDCEPATPDIILEAGGGYYPGLRGNPCSCVENPTLYKVESVHVSDVFHLFGAVWLPPFPGSMPDTDADGVPDDYDNCINEPNPDQLDYDFDGRGNVCDNCVNDFNPLQDDFDADGRGDECDNCFDVYNPGQEDHDEDGQGDLCDSDDDDDGILDDGDESGVIGDNPCENGNTVNCDDNCQYYYNPNQEDYDGDGIGDVCDNDPGACCLPDGNCDVLLASDCSDSSGVFLGMYTVCQGDLDGNDIDDACEAYVEGACCLEDEEFHTCEYMNIGDCLSLGGIFGGPNTGCIGDLNGNGIDDGCEDVEGACCLDGDLCEVLGPYECFANEGNYSGDGTLCMGDNNSNGIDDACEYLFPKVHLWVTRADNESYVKFVLLPIEADFFGPGSDPFDGTVYLRGQPLGILGQTDMVVKRLNGRLPGECGESVAVPIEIIALSLVSTEPLVITYDGGQNPEEWDMNVCLSSWEQEPGNMLIMKNCDHGGTFDTQIRIIPKFIFTRISDDTVREADFHDIGVPAVQMNNLYGAWNLGDPGFNISTSPGGLTWDHDCDPATDEIYIDVSDNFMPGVKGLPCECTSPPTAYEIELTIYKSSYIDVVSFALLPPGEISGYEYFPGDANMANGAWPPSVIGGDVTYLVNYFRGSPSNPPCLLDGFFCSADINGDCNVIGGDVTRLVNYFRGSATLEYCPDFEPVWPTADDLPEEAPPGWPNCE